jgi:peptide/nickel transport system substrate-binding protein
MTQRRHYHPRHSFRGRGGSVSLVFRDGAERGRLQDRPGKEAGMSPNPVPPTSLTRRDLLKAASLATIAVTGPQLRAAPAEAQTPKRGGILRTCNLLDPQGFDPHQTISFATMIPLSFTHSRLLKVKAGPAVKPGTYPVEADLAESWTRTSDTTYEFKLKRGVRWHPKPPVNGRELTAEDVKYTYDRFLTIKGNGNRPALEMVDKIDAPDKYTVKFTLKEPYAWFLDQLASTSTWIVAKECVDQFGDLKKAEACVGTGPWMLEQWRPNVGLTYVRNPSYFVSGLPYADGVELAIDRDPSSRLARWLAGNFDFAPEYQQVVRRLDLNAARQRKSGLQEVTYPWLVTGYGGFRVTEEPFKDVRVRRAIARAVSLSEIFEANAFSLGHWVPNPVVPAGVTDWSIPINELGPEGQKNYQHSTAEAKRLLAEAGHPNGFKTTLETTAGYGPDYMDAVQIQIKNLKSAGVDVDLKLKEYGAFISSTIYGKFDKMMLGLRALFTEPDSYIARPYLPGSPFNIQNVDDSKLTDMIKLQRKTFDTTKRREIVFDIQRHVAEQGYFGIGGSAKVVSAWDAHVRNFGPNNGYDYGGRMMAAWLDK